MVELLQPHEDHQAGDLAYIGHVAGNEDDSTELAQTPTEAQPEAREQSRPDRRKEDTTEYRPIGCTQADGRLLVLRGLILEHRLHRAHHEWQAGEGHGHDDTQRRKGYLDTKQIKVLAIPAILSKERSEER